MGSYDLHRLKLALNLHILVLSIYIYSIYIYLNLVLEGGFYIQAKTFLWTAKDMTFQDFWEIYTLKVDAY